MTQPRDKYGRFVRVPMIWPSMESLNRITRKIAEDQNGFEDFLRRQIGEDYKPRLNGFVKPKEKKHDIIMRALLWSTVGFLGGVIFEMVVQLVTR